MFGDFRSDSMALSHVWLGLPGGRFRSDGGLLIAAATALVIVFIRSTACDVANTRKCL